MTYNVFGGTLNPTLLYSTRSAAALLSLQPNPVEYSRMPGGNDPQER